MRCLLLNLFVLGSLTGALGQIKVSGRIETSDGKPIPFVNVFLMNPGDTSHTTMCLADESGQYEIDRIVPGRYFLQYTAAGFQTYNSAPFELTIFQRNKNIGTIVLYKKEELGTNGSYFLTGGYGMEPKSSVGISINHRSRLLNIYGSYSYSYDKTYGVTTAKGACQFPGDVGKGERVYDYFSEKRPDKGISSATLGLDYQMDKKTTIGISSVITGIFQMTDGYTASDYTLYGDSLLLLRSHMHEKDNLRSSINDINIERILSRDKKINLDVDYIHYKGHNPSTYINSFLDKAGNSIVSQSAAFFPQQDVMNETHINIMAYKIDYEQKLSAKARLEAGIKLSESKVVNFVQVSGLKDGVQTIDASVSGVMTMKEPVKAVYSSLDLDVNKININVGLRYEFVTTSVSYDANAKVGVYREYRNLLPSVLIGRKIAAGTDIRLTYDRSIRMPSYGDIASNVVFNDIYGIAIGNPFLRPVISDNIQAQVQYKQCSFSLIFSRERNAIVSGQQTESLTDSIFYMMSHNLRYQENVALQAGFPIQFTSWWKMDNRLTGAWNQFETLVMPRENFITNDLKNNYFTCDLYSSQKFTFPKSIVLELSAEYNSNSWWGAYRGIGFGVLGIAVKKELKNDGRIQLSVADLLESAHDHSYLDLPHLAYNIRSNIDMSPESRKSRILKITYYRSFGNSKVKGPRKWDMGGQDERNRFSDLDVP